MTSRRANRRAKTVAKHKRTVALWDAIHHVREDRSDHHRVKFFSMRCRCPYCTASRTREKGPR